MHQGGWLTNMKQHFYTKIGGKLRVKGQSHLVFDIQSRIATLLETPEFLRSSWKLLKFKFEIQQKPPGNSWNFMLKKEWQPFKAGLISIFKYLIVTKNTTFHYVTSTIIRYFYTIDGGERQLIDVYQKSADDILNLVEIAGAATERYFHISFPYTPIWEQSQEGINRSVMPLDVLSRTRPTLFDAASFNLDRSAKSNVMGIL